MIYDPDYDRVYVFGGYNIVQEETLKSIYMFETNNKEFIDGSSCRPTEFRMSERRAGLSGFYRHILNLRGIIFFFLLAIMLHDFQDNCVCKMQEEVK